MSSAYLHFLALVLEDDVVSVELVHLREVRVAHADNDDRERLVRRADDRADRLVHVCTKKAPQRQAQVHSIWQNSQVNAKARSEWRTQPRTVDDTVGDDQQNRVVLQRKREQTRN
jgi:hypothetical protein